MILKREHWPHYRQLMRIDRPIGTYLLLWPTLWALWLAAEGVPSIKNLLIFALGTFLMRSAGCAINDFADRHIDGHVQRTRERPLASGAVSSKEALALFAVLCGAAFVLVLFTNILTITLSFGAVALAACYPFMKRYTYMPQAVLGAAFSWSIPMAYAAETNSLPPTLWLLYTAVVVWVLCYDTFYAMVDRDDDIRIGVKSTAILFAENDRSITAILQGFVIIAMIMLGQRLNLGWPYFVGIAGATGLFVYQQWLIRFRERDACFKAFLNNHPVGAVIFAGIAIDYVLR